jgi:hypothetical protein
MRDLAWIDGRMVLFTDDNTNQEKALIAQAMINAFQAAYAQVLNGEAGQ